MSSKGSLPAFRREVWKHYRAHGRHDLPWRKTTNPYRILVSEVMLQQTQVPRVLEKYKEFLRAFPTVKALAKASLSDVLKTWSGLGYNRRGKYLHDAARILAADGRSLIHAAAFDRELPGVGPYTKAAVLVFAFNEPLTLLETNIRAAFIHHFGDMLCKPGLHKQDMKISDRQLLPFMEAAAKGQDPREWHWALMDYGVHLKKLHKNPARRSSAYVRQSKFEGSLRQVRGAILKAIHEGKSVRSLPFDEKRKDLALASLTKDGLIAKAKGGRGVPRWRVA